MLATIEGGLEEVDGVGTGQPIGLPYDWTARPWSRLCDGDLIGV